jgi:hypothetical protein
VIGLVSVSTRLIPVPSRTLKGLQVQYQLNDDTAINFALTGLDEWGNPTLIGLGTPTITSISDPTILQAVIQVDNSLEITPLGKLGTCQVAVSVSVNGTPLSGVLNITIVGGTATSISFVPGSTTPITTTPVIAPPVGPSPTHPPTA